MSSESGTNSDRTAIRFSRILRLPEVVALGCTVTVAVGVFILLSDITHLVAGLSTMVYGAAALVSLLLILPIVERALATVGAGGLYSLAPVGGSNWAGYSIGWILVGGHVFLAALLAWGSAQLLNLELERLFEVTIDARWTALVLVGLVALQQLVGTWGSWRARTGLTYGSILVLLVLIIGWLIRPEAGTLASGKLLPMQTFTPVVVLLAANLWGVSLILDHREQIKRPNRVILPAVLISWGIGSLLGVGATIVLRLYPDLAFSNSIPLFALFSSASVLGGVLFLLAGFILGLLALERTLAGGLRLVGLMTRDGFFPKRFQTLRPGQAAPVWHLVFYLAMIAIGIAWLSIPVLAGLAAMAFLAVVVLIYSVDFVRHRSHLPETRRLKLPFHPLFPGIAVALSIYLLISLPGYVWVVGGLWALNGVVLYILYARKGGITARQRSRLVGETHPRGSRPEYRVLVGVANPQTAPSLVKASAALARSQKGELIVLQVVPLPEQVPVHVKRRTAEEAWMQLESLVADCEIIDVPVQSVVRLAPTPADGILETAWEEQSDLIMLGWTGQGVGKEIEQVLEPVIRSAPCAVAMLRGLLTKSIDTALVPVAGGPHAIQALQLARDFVAVDRGRVIALNVVRGRKDPDRETQASEYLQEAIGKVDGGDWIDPKVVWAQDIKAGILQEAAQCDLLLLGASKDGFLGQTIFGGLPVEIAQANPQPTLLVKRYEGFSKFWMRRARELIALPTLTAGECAEVSLEMRQAAWAGADFYTLILLASVIATMGLLRNSAAVIIGAMLVAPLMSPILAIAHSLVLGDLGLLRRAGDSTIKGVTLTVGVAFAITLMLPTQLPTGETLARTGPNVIDLMIALASGAAAAYAVSRKQVAAALPGVAIAAALVPPLCVVGYGLGAAQLQIAGDALLLFVANLSAIILAGAIVFFILGFRPLQAQGRKQVRRGILISMISLAIIAVPLTFHSVSSGRQIEQNLQIETVLREEMRQNGAQVEEIVVEKQEDSLLVSATVYEFEDLTSEDVNAVQEALSYAVGEPLVVRFKVIPASMMASGVQPVVIPLP